MGKRGKARRERKRARLTGSGPDTLSLAETPSQRKRRRRRDGDAPLVGSDTRVCAAPSTDYVATPLFVLRDTLACAFYGCVVCAYKVCVSPGASTDGPFLPNERPERCLRALGVLRRAAGGPPHWCGLYSAHDRILTVGDGDLSFSASLVQCLRQPLDTGGARRQLRLLATSIEREARLCSLYPRASNSLTTLRDAKAASSCAASAPMEQAQGAELGAGGAHDTAGVQVGFEVDATRLVDTLPRASASASASRFPCFDCCVFNFPCIRVAAGLDAQLAHLDANRDLVKSFCNQAMQVVVPGGEVHITHKSRPPFSLVSLQPRPGKEWQACVDAPPTSVHICVLTVGARAAPRSGT